MRGLELRERMLYTAKTVFLEMGFERASMDEIAARAETSKRTLYAHFENKEKLYLAVIDLVRTMYLTKLKTPGEYSDDTTEALVLFCGRFLEGLLFAWTIRMCRLSISEADRFPELVSKGYELRWYCLEPLASYFEALSMKGVMALDDAPRAAQQFMHLVTSSVDSLFESEETFAKEHERWISSAVRIFLHGALRRS